MLRHRLDVAGKVRKKSGEAACCDGFQTGGKPIAVLLVDENQEIFKGLTRLFSKVNLRAKS